MGGNESQSLLYDISSLKNCVPKTQNREIYNSGECYFTRGWLLTYFLGGCSAQITPSNRSFIIRMNLGGFFLRVCEKFPENLCTLFWFSKKIFFFTWKYFPNKQKRKTFISNLKKNMIHLSATPYSSKQRGITIVKKEMKCFAL